MAFPYLSLRRVVVSCVLATLVVGCGSSDAHRRAFQQNDAGTDGSASGGASGSGGSTNAGGTTPGGGGAVPGSGGVAPGSGGAIPGSGGQAHDAAAEASTEDASVSNDASVANDAGDGAPVAVVDAGQCPPGVLPNRIASCLAVVDDLGDNELQRIFYANGRHYLFYNDGTGLVVGTSADGVTWGTPMPVPTVAGGYGSVWLDVKFDGTFFHYVGTSAGILYYNRGLLNADGTIAWETERIAWQQAGASTGEIALGVNSVHQPVLVMNRYQGGFYDVSYIRYDGTTFSGLNTAINGWLWWHPGAITIGNDVGVFAGNGVGLHHLTVISTTGQGADESLCSANCDGQRISAVNCAGNTYFTYASGTNIAVVERQPNGTKSTALLNVLPDTGPWMACDRSSPTERPMVVYRMQDHLYITARGAAVDGGNGWPAGTACFQKPTGELGNLVIEEAPVNGVMHVAYVWNPETTHGIWHTTCAVPP
jgi:hypothetical protein